ncbi:MAG: hypothetical protein HOV83_13185 [Catenulispora sp.]|nr:hypothetical protein [Catenulispora sp.]
MTREAEGFLADLLGTVGSLDRVFVSWRKEGVQPSTAQALDWFWEQPEAEVLRAVADRPHLVWDELTDAVLDLAAAEPVGDDIDWVALADEAQRLTGRDLVAGAAVAMYAVAGWMGCCGDGLLQHPPDPLWYLVPALAGSALLTADAVHGADLLSSRARKFVDQAEREIHRPAYQTALIPLRQLAAGIAQRRDEDVEALAWDLHAACRPAAPHMRAEVAALFWTIGDVPRAHLVAGGAESGYVPTLDVMRDLVAVTMARVRDDPLLQYIWLAMKDRPPLDLRRHHRLFALLNARYTHAPAHEIDALLDVPISQVYAKALIAHFADRPPDGVDGIDNLDDLDDLHDLLAAEWQMAAALLGNQEPLVHLRLACLVNLLLSAPEDQPARWRQMADTATAILRDTVERGDFTTYHRCLALPTFYLPPESALSADEALAAVEEHRAAGLRYWLTAAAPPPPRYDGLVDVLQSEVRLLDRLRAARFVRLTPHLPWTFQGFSVDLRAAVRHGDTDTHPLDQERAAESIAEAWHQLGELWERAREISPEYAEQRANPVSRLDEFAHALTATTPSTVPVGPTPIRRTRDDRAVWPDQDRAPAATPPDEETAEDSADAHARAEQDRRATELAARADVLVQQYFAAPDPALLDLAIDAAAQACELVDEGSEVHLRNLDRLAMIHAGRFLDIGDEADIDAAVAAHEAAAALAGPEQIPVSLRVMLHFNAAMSHHHRYQHTGDIDDLRRSIEHSGAAFSTPDIDPEQATMVFQRHTSSLHELYERTRDPAILAMRIAAHRAVVDIAPQDPNRVSYLAGLALQLLRDHNEGAGVELVTEAIELLRQAVRLARQSDPRNLLPVLNNLALALLTRHAASHDTADFDQAIVALDEAAATAPLGPTRADLLESLAELLEQRFAQRGDAADAVRAGSARSHAAEVRGGN